LLWPATGIEREQLASVSDWRVATRCGASQADHASARYDMGPARRDFGYVPRVSIAEGLERLAAACHGN
jgi:hypothetical protein